MMYTKGENPMVVDSYDGPKVVDICNDCGTEIYEEDFYYNIDHRTLCESCGKEWLNGKYGRYALCV